MATLRTVQCDSAEFELSLIEGDVEDKRVAMLCFEPWVVTQNVLMILMLTIFFYGLPLVFKVGLLVFISVSHILTIEAYIFAWKRTRSTNVGLQAELAHIWNIVTMCLVVMLQELHVTYISKVNYHSKLRYEEKLRQTENRTRSIQIILSNILPTHVVDIFLDRARGEELFYENYNKVAVMFAYIENFQPDKVGLRVLNEYICYYDDLLAEYVSNFKVEKIKVIGWTYMAACGLQPENMTDFSKRRPERHRKQRSIFRRNGLSFRAAEEHELPRRSTFQPRYVHPELKTDDNCVLTMLNFALDMLRVMQDIALQNMYLDYGGSMRGQLKIGVSHGPVMAGVVGLSPPHYDIWGHPVNMASRMTSTGVLGAIQVTENTALILRYFDIKCDYRGMTHVKGVGEIPTYLVAMDETLNFQNYDDEEMDTLLIINDSTVPSSPVESRVVFIDVPESVSDDTEKENEKGTETDRKPGGGTDHSQSYS
ncbi:adenylyl cyclase X E-like [Drosophila innubila]|uniref:adenylyl cyclase X E-like n=1 Tax=Drosophila innubila TaxID=198719 RepID=UPI00148D0942|nr:adenylyl cyclase X E-like [Drosophila innubila]